MRGSPLRTGEGAIGDEQTRGHSRTTACRSVLQTGNHTGRVRSCTLSNVQEQVENIRRQFQVCEPKYHMLGEFVPTTERNVLITNVFSVLVNVRFNQSLVHWLALAFRP